MQGVTPFPSLRNPIKLTAIGDNGKQYHFIAKYGEDLRQDQRIQQAFSLCNSMLGAGQQTSLPDIVTYAVVPFNERLGVLEFVPKTVTYKYDLMQFKHRHWHKSSGSHNISVIL